MIRFLLILALTMTAVPMAASADTFGAVAYSFQTNKFGRSWNYSSRESAQKAAVDYCKSAGGKRCEVGVYVQDSCGAFARSETSKNMAQTGVSWGFSSAAASHNRAISECEQRDGAGTCRVIASVCSDRKE